ADQAGLRLGADLSRALIAKAAQAITLQYVRRGYPQVRLRAGRLTERGEVRDLSIEVAEGQQQLAGELIASGNYKTSTKTMLRGFPWDPGLPLDPARIARLRERQVDIGVLDSVLI